MPGSDTAAETTLTLPDGVVETLGAGPVKPSEGFVETGIGSTLVSPDTTCNPTCGAGGVMPPVTLKDSSHVKYSALNGNVEADESSHLTGGQGFPTFNTQFASSTATFWWLGTKPSFNWRSYVPAFKWTQTTSGSAFRPACPSAAAATT